MWCVDGVMHIGAEDEDRFFQYAGAWALFLALCEEEFAPWKLMY